MADKKITYYDFLTEVREFLSKLLKNPIKTEPSKKLKDNDITKKKLIDSLIKQDILERHEKILDDTNSDEKKPKYVVTYKVKKKDFNKRVHRVYIKFFEKNIPLKDNINECDCGGAMGGGCNSGVDGGDGINGSTSTNINMGHPDILFGTMIRRGKKNDKKNNKPENILGKTITAENKIRKKKIYITESQLNKLVREMAIGDAGAMGDYTANGLVLKTSDGKEDPCAKAGKIKVKTVMDNKPCKK